jgi:hypothetical protein
MMGAGGNFIPVGTYFVQPKPDGWWTMYQGVGGPCAVYGFGTREKAADYAGWKNREMTGEEARADAEWEALGG